MKKIILLGLLCIMCSQTINAQFSIGLSNGVNFANQRLDGLEDTDTRFIVLYFVGITPRYKIDDRVSILMDIQYSQKGTVLENADAMGESKFRYTYFDLLPEVEYYLHENIRLGLGFNVGLRIEEEQKFEEEDWVSTGDVDIIKSTDFGLIGSLKGYFGGFTVTARYNVGLRDISNISFTDINGNLLDEVKQFNSTIQVGFGYFFELGEK